ncbi:MAG: exo-alpha-sialidase [Gemmatimonadetes bacterium]|nr:exo-alpha-sialidase [Gemmatimonadota bacterium]
MKTERRSGAAAALLAAGVLVSGGCGGSRGDGLGPARTLAASGAGNPTTAADPRTGAAYVAWVGTQRGESDVYLARLAGSAPPAPVRVNTLPGDASTHDQAPPQVALGPRGEVYVLWQKSVKVPGRMYPKSDLRFARSLDGGRTWGPAGTVNDDAGGLPSSHTFHDLAVAPDGTVYVSWIDGRARDQARAARTRSAPAARPAAPAPATGAGMQHMHGGHDEAGLPGSEIRVARSVDGGRTFSASTVVDGDACPCCRTAMALGPDGSVYVTWRKVFPGSVRDVVVARSTDGGRSFAAPVRVHRDGWVFPGCPEAGPSVAVDGTGRVHVGWYTGKEGHPGLFYAVSTDGGRSFGAPVPLVTGEWVPPSQVRVVADGDGAWVAWDDRREQAKKVYLGRVSDGEVRVVDSRPGTLPDLAITGGARSLAWRDGEAVRVQVSLGGEGR